MTQNIMAYQHNPTVSSQVFDVSISTVGEGFYGFRMQIKRFCLFDYILILILNFQQDETNQA